MFDIEVDELNPDKFIDVGGAGPTFGGINPKTSKRRNVSTSSKSCASA